MDSGLEHALWSALLLLTQIAAVVAVAFRVSARLVPDRSEPAVRALVGVLVAIAEVLVVLELLGAVGLLAEAPMLAILVLVAAVVLARLPRSGEAGGGPGGGSPPPLITLCLFGAGAPPGPVR